MRTSGRRLAPVVTVATLATVALAPVDASVHRGSLPKLPSPQRFEPRGIAPSLARPGPTMLRVRLLLRSEPLVAAADSQRRAVVTDVRQAAARVAQRRREVGLSRLHRAALATTISERPIAEAVTRLGGKLLKPDSVLASVTAEVPATALPRLARRSDVQAIEPAPEPHALTLAAPTEAVGAPTWWYAGHTGGRGAADTSPAALAIVGDPIYRRHPAFSEIPFETPPGAQTVDGPGGLHGTAVASMAVSQGASGCSLCVASDADQKGTAPGPAHVLDTWDAANQLAWAVGEPWSYWSNSQNEYLTQSGAPDPADVISYSRGDPETADDGIDQQGWDAYVDEFGVTAAIAAGNSGPTAGSINEPADAYNVIGVGGFDGGANATDRSSDTVFSWSSEGPTAGGRKKPDLVAVGNADLADSEFETDGTLWHYMTGTSFAAPQVAGAATLLAGSGLLDPKAVKALLIDAARPGRATPTDVMGSQRTWQPDWGWGELDLDQALAERNNVTTGAVPANGTLFYRSNAQSAGDRATLVWDRRVTTCFSAGCTAAKDSSWHVFTLSHLALTAIDPASGAVETTSASAVDNVQQVRAPAAGPVIYAVSAGPVDGLSGEPFALAAANGLQPLASPQPAVSLTASDPRPLAPGAPVTVSARVTNPSPDLTAEHAGVTLTVPAGVSIVSGPASVDLGTLGTKGSGADTAVATWVVTGASDGIHQLVATAAADRYGATFSSSAAAAITVDVTPPDVTLATNAANAAVALVWGATDRWSAVAAYDVAVSTDGGQLVPWLTATEATAATYQGATGHTYEFAVRACDSLGNCSAYLRSSAIAISAPAAPQPVGGAPPARAAVNISLGRVSRSARRISLAGTLAAAAHGAVRVEWRTRVGRHAYRGIALTHARGGRFHATLELPPPARHARLLTLTLRYPGDGRFGAQARSYVIRLQR